MNLEYRVQEWKEYQGYKVSLAFRKYDLLEFVPFTLFDVVMAIENTFENNNANSCYAFVGARTLYISDRYLYIERIKNVEEYVEELLTKILRKLDIKNQVKLVKNDSLPGDELNVAINVDLDEYEDENNIYVYFSNEEIGSSNDFIDATLKQLGFDSVAESIYQPDNDELSLEEIIEIFNNSELNEIKFYVNE